MWKTPQESMFPADARCHLCPCCESLGPHEIMREEVPKEAWLQCIDCGILLGRWSPHGLLSYDDDEATVVVIPRRELTRLDPAAWLPQMLPTPEV